MTEPVLDPQTLELLQTTRQMFEQILEQSVGQRTTEGSCLYASVLLRETLNKWSPFDAIVRGGGPLEREACGFHDGRQWQGHYWVELQRDGVPVAVADITADQFGGPPVQVLPWEYAVLRYRAGAQADVDEAAAEVLDKA